MQERVLRFACQGEALIGVLSEPQAPVSDLGILIIVGGPQYRAGSHRQFVLQARAWAAAGHRVMRFDYRGMGDASGAQRDFEQVNDDIEAALDAFAAACPDLRGFVLWGLCDAASAALLYLESRPQERRVLGLALANPWVRSAEGLARAQAKHYYTQRLREREFWMKLLRGGVGLQALRGLFSNLAALLKRPAARAQTSKRQLSFQERMALGLRNFEGPTLLLLSGLDLTAKEFLDHAAHSPDWNGLLAAPRLQRADFAEADHTFSAPADLQAMIKACSHWLDGEARKATTMKEGSR